MKSKAFVSGTQAEMGRLQTGTQEVLSDSQEALLYSAGDGGGCLERLWGLHWWRRSEAGWLDVVWAKTSRGPFQRKSFSDSVIW